MRTEGERREEILETAASLLASSGIRTSLKEIGDACGILPGSLYHHFESKDAIIIELVQRYRDELDQVAAGAVAALRDPGPSIDERITTLSEAIAACGVRNRAALLLTLYEPPATASDPLVELAQLSPVAVTQAMVKTIEYGQASGEIRPEVDAFLLSSRICQSMLHMGVGVFHRSQAAKGLPALKCRVFLEGLAQDAPTDRALDRSEARRVADEIIASWSGPEEESREAQLRAAGRTEFARRGFEATTMRDVAKSADLSTGTVYRTYRSKDDLLLAIMRRFSDTFSTAWDAVLASPGSVVEQLDALMWVNINLIDVFNEEFRIQLAWLRQNPPDSIDLGLSFGKQIRQLQRTLVAGEKDGTLRVIGGSATTRARSLYELLLTPESIVVEAGRPAALELARGTVLRGARTRR